MRAEPRGHDFLSRDRFDAGQLAETLRSNIRGPVLHDSGSRALYATDASNYRRVPDLVVLPGSAEELAAAVTLAAEAGAPVVLRGAGTSMAGNAIGGVVIDTSRHVNRILDVDPVAATAVIEPGVVLSDLNAAAGVHGLTFGPDPSSASRATLGGMIANNACGAHSVAFGTTADNVQQLDVVLADGTRMDVPSGAASEDTEPHIAELLSRPAREGEIHRALLGLVRGNEMTIERRFSGLKRRISGYALDRLLPANGYDPARFLCGTEGTLATTLRATVRLVRLPACRALLVLGFEDSIAAAESVPVILRHGPLTMESINAALVERLPAQTRMAAVRAGLPEGKAWLLVEVGGADLLAAAAAGKAIEQDLGASGLRVATRVVTEPQAQAVLWRCRRDGTGLATRRADGAEAWAGWEDAAVPPERLATYLRELDELMARHELSGASYGHFGEGCMHMRMDFDLLTPAGVDAYRSFVEEATELVITLGGSVSGEHGDGRARSELLERMYGADITRLFAEVKAIWDPAGAMNPGVIVLPDRLDANMRHVGPAKDRQLHTIFSYPEDAGDFAQAQRRCVGVGKCRQSSGGVMCPSYQVTREEKHSTRGRAHLLWEMLQGDVITEGWRSTEVKEALDLCLSCKGCLSDCPVNVDMATYKAEFLHHHYRRRIRPLSHYSMGWLPLWSRFVALAPRLANRLARSRWQAAMKRLAGIAAEREIPTFAEQSFTSWFHRRTRPVTAATPRRSVLLWPDTFTNYLSPEVARSAVRVLEAAGFHVVIPRGHVCCGLTWISTGQLGMTKRVLRRSLDHLQDVIESGTPVVGLEPSCTAVFRHEAASLLPEDDRAQRMKHSTYTLAEFLAAYAPDWSPPALNVPALVQRHCHQYAVMGFEADAALMKASGVDADILDAGCCGLAGNFGFEEGHYEVSLAAGERALLPAVRAADPARAVVADGFSCRTQIAHGTPRQAVHLAELLASGLASEGRSD
jgi:FAD/FMN-containing dehydrogenase/Fe-S oxidoreductase